MSTLSRKRKIVGRALAAIVVILIAQLWTLISALVGVQGQDWSLTVSMGWGMVVGSAGMVIAFTRIRDGRL